VPLVVALDPPAGLQRLFAFRREDLTEQIAERRLVLIGMESRCRAVRQHLRLASVPIRSSFAPGQPRERGCGRYEPSGLDLLLRGLFRQLRVIDAAAALFVFERYSRP